MSLGKLLAAGKSIISGCRKPAYREDKNVYLPKFVSPKNPFAALSAEPQAQSSVETVKSRIATVAAKTQKLPEISGSSKSLVAWTSKLNPATMFRSQPSVTPARPAVQVELSLDSVKVVHNDLSDADVEVVPIKSRPTMVRPVVPDLPPAEKAWELLGERMMKVEVS